MSQTAPRPAPFAPERDPRPLSWRQASERLSDGLRPLADRGRGAWRGIHVGRTGGARRARRSALRGAAGPCAGVGEAERVFLPYAFVWTGATLRGHLVAVSGAVATAAAAGGLGGGGGGGGLADASLTGGEGEQLRALERLLGARGRAEFAARVGAHVRELPRWRAAVQPAAPRDLPALCLLELAPHGSPLRRDRFAGVHVVAAAPFDFRPDGAAENIARAASAAAAARISNAAMIALMALQDELVDERDRGTPARLADDIVALYDQRHGTRFRARKR